MTKQYFLVQLQRELNSRIGSQNAASFVEYYQEYIEIELRKGRSIEEIMEKLGSPGLIARSITEAFRRKEQKASKGRKQEKFIARMKSLAGGMYRRVFEKAGKWFAQL